MVFSDAVFSASNNLGMVKMDESSLNLDVNTIKRVMGIAVRLGAQEVSQRARYSLI